MKEKFNQSEYIKQYNKDNYIQKKFYLRKDEKEKLDQVLKKENETLKNYLMKKIEKDLKKYWHIVLYLVQYNCKHEGGIENGYRKNRKKIWRIFKW